jgi:hypothetical protein
VFALSKIKKTIYYFASEEAFAQHKKEKVRNFLGTINLQVCVVCGVDSPQPFSRFRCVFWMDRMRVFTSQ